MASNRSTTGFWSYQAADPTPSLQEAIVAGAISSDTTEEKWDCLTPGLRREIVRTAAKRNDNRRELMEQGQ